MSDDGTVSKMIEAINACEEDARGKSRTCSGEIVCPLCAGRLRYQFGRRRMFRLVCETEGCLKAMS